MGVRPLTFVECKYVTFAPDSVLSACRQCHIFCCFLSFCCFLTFLWDEIANRGTKDFCPLCKCPYLCSVVGRVTWKCDGIINDSIEKYHGEQ